MPNKSWAGQIKLLGLLVFSALPVRSEPLYYHLQSNASSTTFRVGYAGTTPNNAVLVASGSVVLQSTSPTVGHPVLRILDSSGTEFISGGAFGLHTRGPVPHVNVKAFGAKGDGTTDDTSAIQTALNSVKNSGGLVFIPPGTYLYSTPLRIGSSVTVEGAGRGLSIIKQKNNNMPGGGQDDGAAFINYNFSLSTSTDQNIEIRNLTVDGNYQNNPDIAAGSAGGISMTYATDVRIINVEIANVDGYGGIYYGAQNLSDSGGYLSRNLPGITVSECFIHDSTSTTAGGSYGSGMFLSAQQSVHLDVHDNFLLNNRTAIYLEDSASQADIHDNHITNTSNGPTGSGVSVEQGNGPSTQVNVHHNTISYMSYGVTVGGNGIRAVIVDGNIISTCTNAGIYVATPGDNNALGSYIKISNNLVRDTLSGPGIQVGSLSSTVTVSGNLCYDEKVTRTQTYGLFIDSFAKNVHVDASNQFDSNLTGPINNLSTTTTISYCAGGNCAIGMSSSSYRLDVNGDVRATNFRGPSVGVTDASAATAGNVGEYVEASTTSYTNWSCASGSWCDGPSITLTAGDWDVSMTAGAQLNASVMTTWGLGAGTAVSPNNTDISQGVNQFSCVLPTAANSTNCSVARFRSNSASTVIWYMKLNATWTGATPQMIGTISARRAR